MSGRYVMQRGWMKHSVFRDEPYTEREAWLWLIENAAWKETVHRIGSEVVAIERGQLAVSMRQLTGEWKWSLGRVSRFFDLLKKQDMIETRNGTAASTAKSIVSICNYDSYQFSSDNDGGSGGTTTKPRTERKRYNRGDTKEEGNKDSKNPPLVPPETAKAKPRHTLAGDEPMPNVDHSKYPGLDMDAEWDACRNHHASKGTIVANEAALFRTWLGNAVNKGWAQKPRAAPSASLRPARTDAQWRDLMKSFVERKKWWGGGPEPGFAGCQVPPHILAEFNLGQSEAA